MAKEFHEPRLCPRLLGAQWQHLDERVRRFHEDTTARPHRGTFRIRRGCGVLARAAALLFGFPRDGDAVPTRLVVTCQVGPSGPYETWHRTWGKFNLVSRQRITANGLLAERFGRVELTLRVTADNGALCLASTGVLIVFGPLRLRLPVVLAPSVQASVATAQSGVQVRVVLTAPLAGLLLEYAGELETAQ